MYLKIYPPDKSDSIRIYDMSSCRFGNVFAHLGEIQNYTESQGLEGTSGGHIVQPLPAKPGPLQ